MTLYLDSSALVKLVHTEAETPALQAFLQGHRSDRQATSTLARTEVVRAALPLGPASVAAAQRVLRRIHQLEMGRSLLDAAGALQTQPPLRSLDAIHVASARTIADLRSIVTYDDRMIAAARFLGLPVVAPV